MFDSLKYSHPNATYEGGGITYQPALVYENKLRRQVCNDCKTMKTRESVCMHGSSSTCGPH